MRSTVPDVDCLLQKILTSGCKQKLLEEFQTHVSLKTIGVHAREKDPTLGPKILRYCIEAAEKDGGFVLRSLSEIAQYGLELTFSSTLSNPDLNIATLDRIVTLLFHLMKHCHKVSDVQSMVVFSAKLFDLRSVFAFGLLQNENIQKVFFSAHQLCLATFTDSLKSGIKLISNEVEQIFVIRVTSLGLLALSNKDFSVFLASCHTFVNQLASHEENVHAQRITFILLKQLQAIFCCDSLTAKILTNLVSWVDVVWKAVVLYMSLMMQIKSAESKENQLIMKSLLKQISDLNDVSARKGSVLGSLFEIVITFASSEPRLQHGCMCEYTKNKKFFQNYQENVCSLLREGKAIEDIGCILDCLDFLRKLSDRRPLLCKWVTLLLLNIVIDFLVHAQVLEVLKQLPNQDGMQKATIRFLTHLMWGIDVSQISLSNADAHRASVCMKEGNSSHEVASKVSDLFSAVDQVLCLARNLNSDVVKRLGTQLFNKGLDAYRCGSFEHARVLFNVSVQLRLSWCERSESCLKSVVEGRLVEMYIQLLVVLKKLELHSLCVETCEEAFAFLCSAMQGNSAWPDDVNVSVCSLVRTYVQTKLHLFAAEPEKYKNQYRSLYERLKGSPVDYIFWKNVLEQEYKAYKSQRMNQFGELELLLQHQLALYEAHGDMPRYSSILIELASIPTLDAEQRLHWCQEAIDILDAMRSEMAANGDEDLVRWHVNDALALAHFQCALLLYERQVSADSIDIQDSIITLDGPACGNGSGEIVEDGFKWKGGCSRIMEQPYFASMDIALELWTNLVLESRNELSNGKVSLEWFVDAFRSGCCLHQAAAFNALICQSTSSIRAGYLSSLIFDALSSDAKSPGMAHYKADVMWLCATQLIAMDGWSLLDGLLEAIDTNSCMQPVKAKLDVVRAWKYFHDGQLEMVMMVINSVLESDVLQEQTCVALSVKAELYLLIAHVKQLPSQVSSQFLVLLNSTNDHCPGLSPLPVVNDVLKFLRGISDHMQDSLKVVKNYDVSVISQWLAIDRLISSLMFCAEILKEQGSVLEARCILKEALLLSRKFDLSIRIVEIMHLLAGIDLIRLDQESYCSHFNGMSWLLEASVGGCLNEKEICVPTFLYHTHECRCTYCTHFKLQGIIINLFLQYCEQLQRLTSLTSSENATDAILFMIRNARARHGIVMSDLRAFLKIPTGQAPCGSSTSAVAAVEQAVVKGKRGNVKSKNLKSRKAVSKTDGEEVLKDENGWGSFNGDVFCKFELQLAHLRLAACKHGNRKITSVDSIINKLELCRLLKVPEHSYCKLLAQIYCLKSLVFIANNHQGCFDSNWYPALCDNLSSLHLVDVLNSSQDLPVESIEKGMIPIDPTNRRVRGNRGKAVNNGANRVLELSKKDSGRGSEHSPMVVIQSDCSPSLPAPAKSKKKVKGCKVECVSKSVCEENSGASPPLARKTNSRKPSRSRRNAKESGLISEDDDSSSLSERCQRQTKCDTRHTAAMQETEATPPDASDGLLGNIRQSLSLQNPFCDSLTIKAAYQLLALLTGAKQSSLSVSSQLLSSARTLHQETLHSLGRKLRKSGKRVKSKAPDSALLPSICSTLEKFSDPEVVFASQDLQDLVNENIPSGWRLVSLSYCDIYKESIILSRMEPFEAPVTVRINISEEEVPQVEGHSSIVKDLASAFESNLFDEFAAILDGSLKSMGMNTTSAWWKERQRLDKRMANFVLSMEQSWLRGWKGFLLGCPCDTKLLQDLKDVSRKTAKSLAEVSGVDVGATLVHILMEVASVSQESEVLECLATLVGVQNAKQSFQIVRNAWSEARSLMDKFGKITRHPIILILDKKLQHLPWESIPVLRGQPVSRMPSVLLAVTHCMMHKNLLETGVNTRNVYYVLNPSTDLTNTQKTFQPIFQSHLDWNGVIGRPPSSTEFSVGLSDHDLFIYCGHGSGQDFLNWSRLKKISCRAAVFLMGCSSGKLKVCGDLEPQGMVYYYLLAGCPALVANLWDVTDKDIDRFLVALLESWLPSEGNGGVQETLLSCVSASRDACQLRYLIGAAPVVYGLPLHANGL